MRTKAGSSSYFCRNVQVPLDYRTLCRVVGGLLLACFNLEAVPTAQGLVWTAETQGLTLRQGIWWDRWRHFESCRREVLQAVGLRWGDGKGFGALLHPAGNIQEDKVKKALEMASSGKVTNLWKGHSVPKLSLLFYTNIGRSIAQPCPQASPSLWHGRLVGRQLAQPLFHTAGHFPVRQAPTYPIAHNAFALRITHGISCKHHQHLQAVSRETQ